MTDQPNLDLINELVNAAVDISIQLEQEQVSPFNLLEALVENPDAQVMCEAVEFPFSKLCDIVDQNLVNYIPSGSSSQTDNQNVTLSPLFVKIFETAINLTKEYNQSDVGYLGILKGLRDHGDNFCKAALSETLLNVTDEDFDNFLKGEQVLQIPRSEVSTSFYNAANDNGKVLQMADTLKKRIVGQDHVIDILSQGVEHTFAGLQEANKPVGSYLFAGPTGVGKTEVPQQLAKFLGVELIRFDMSEYMDEYSAKNLTGASAGLVGYVQGGLLTNAIAANPACVLLLDEMEKSHPSIQNLLLQVMDNATISDSQGNKVDCSNVIIIMTSNEGVTDISKPTLGFHEATSGDQSANYKEAINKRFPPEFRNRLDDIVIFNHLEKDHITEITKILVKEMNELPAVEKCNLSFSATPRAIQAIAEQGYNKAMGARPIKNFIKKNINHMLSPMILNNTLKDKKVVISYSPKEGGFYIKENPLPKSKQPKAEQTTTDIAEPAPVRM